jgi:glycosyltransferase involved in cell wall biosynthesis
LIKAFINVHKTLPDTRLVLVGDGSERQGLERLVKEAGLINKVIFTGRQPFSKIPYYVSTFDVAVVSARSAEGFHYSPLKLREYLAAGKAVLAPNAGEISQLFSDNQHLKLYQAGSVEQLTQGLFELIQNPDLRHLLASQGKEYAMNSSTWDFELNKLMANFKIG